MLIHLTTNWRGAERSKDSSEGLFGVSFQETEKWLWHMNYKVTLTWEVICVEPCYEDLECLTEGARLMPISKYHWSGVGSSRLQMCLFKTWSMRSQWIEDRAQDRGNVQCGCKDNCTMTKCWWEKPSAWKEEFHWEVVTLPIVPQALKCVMGWDQ